MKRLLLALVILAAVTAPAQADSFWRDSGRACFFGAAVLGISAAMVLYPAVASGATTLPATALVVGNTVFGCGLGMVGSVAAYSFDALYEKLFSDGAAAPLDSEPAPPPPVRKNQGSVT
jgi:hypothetical protein